MDASLTLQYAVITVVVVLSAWVVAKKQFPGSVRKARIAIALPLLREGKPAWQRALGKWVAPPGSYVGGKLDGKDCGGCNGCG